MEKIFIQVLNMSYQAGIVILFILLARYLLFLLKAPKKFSYILWAIPFIRMIVPFTVKSIFSLLPKEHTPVKYNIAYMEEPKIYTGSKVVNQVISSSLPAATPYSSINPMQMILFLLQCIWIAGMIGLAVYGMVTYFSLKRKLTCSILLTENIYIADYIHTPFVLGVIKPCIYLPSSMEEGDMEYVILHERTHILRKDYIIKIVAFLITCVYWFHPLSWVAYFCLGKDMEMSCDEAVMQKLNETRRKEYAATLLGLTIRKQGIVGVPLAFGEGDTKERIKNIIKYKKAGVAVILIAVILTICLSIGLITNPDIVRKNNASLKEAILTIEDETKKVCLNDLISFEWTELYTFSPYVDVKTQESIMGLTSKELKESTNEDMLLLVFLNDKEVVSSICSYPEELGYDMMLYPTDSIKSNANHIKITKEQRAEFFVKKNNGIITLNYLTAGMTDDGKAEAAYLESSKNKKEIKRVAMTEPVITADMSLGADGAILDYSNHEIIVFHGYFGLFVYSMEKSGLIGALNLADIGCQYTQGDYFCDVRVALDGSSVYLHPMNENEMYEYKIAEQELYKMEYSFEGLDLFEGFGGSKRSPSLTSKDDTLDSLIYIEDDMIVEPFSSIFHDTIWMDKQEGEIAPIPNTVDSEILNRIPLKLSNNIWCLNPSYFSIDNKIVEVRFYDKFSNASGIARAGSGEIAKFSYKFDESKKEIWSATADGKTIEIEVMPMITEDGTYGVLAKWSNNDINYILWEQSQKQEVDLTIVAKLAIEIAKESRL